MVMSGIGLLLGLGAVLAVAHRDAAWMLTPLQKAVDGVAWLVWLVGLVWLPVTAALPWLVLVGLWQIGRRTGGCRAGLRLRRPRAPDGDRHPGRGGDGVGAWEVVATGASAVTNVASAPLTVPAELVPTRRKW